MLQTVKNKYQSLHEKWSTKEIIKKKPSEVVTTEWEQPNGTNTGKKVCESRLAGGWL